MARPLPGAVSRDVEHRHRAVGDGVRRLELERNLHPRSASAGRAGGPEWFACARCPGTHLGGASSTVRLERRLGLRHEAAAHPGERRDCRRSRYERIDADGLFDLPRWPGHVPQAGERVARAAPAPGLNVGRAGGRLGAALRLVETARRSRYAAAVTWTVSSPAAGRRAWRRTRRGACCAWPSRSWPWPGPGAQDRAARRTGTAFGGIHGGRGVVSAAGNLVAARQKFLVSWPQVAVSREAWTGHPRTLARRTDRERGR